MTASGTLFSFIQIDPESLISDIDKVASPPCRFQAFLRSVQEFGVLLVEEIDGRKKTAGLEPFHDRLKDANNLWVGKFKASRERRPFHENSQRFARQFDQIEESLYYGTIRVLMVSPHELQNTREIRIPYWEESTLGNPWHACIVPEGREVEELLEPAFRSHDHVVVLDPGLGAQRKRSCIARRLLIEICRDHGVRRLEVFTESGIWIKDEKKCGKQQKWQQEKWQQELKIELRRLRDQPDNQKIKMTWNVKSHEGDFHDRFVGFTRKSPGEISYQAVTLGCGVLSFIKDGSKRRLTAVARIPGDAFQKALEATQKLFKSSEPMVVEIN